MSSNLHGKVFDYIQINNIPTRDKFLDKDIYNETQELIIKNKDLLFMPNAIHEMNLQEKKYKSSVYKIILFGVLQDGRKTTVVISGISPYFEVIIPDQIDICASENEKNKREQVFQLFSKLQNLNNACPEKFEIIKAKSFKGYHKDKKLFARFYFNKLTNRKEAINYVEELGYETTTNDKSCYYRVVCRDYQTSFSSWINLSNYKIKSYPVIRGNVFDVNIKDYKEYKGDITLNYKLSKDNIMSCCWDIETYSSDGQLPKPENLDHKLFMIGMTFQWHHSDNQLLRVCLVDHHCDPKPDYLTIVCETEENIIRAFGIILNKLKPDIILGFNDSDYDWPWLIKRALHYKGLLGFLGENLDSTIHWAKYDDNNIIKYNYKKERVKLESDMYADGYYLSYPGYICVDVRTVFRQLYPTDEKSNLNYYLSLNKLGGKKDMPYQELFKIYEEMTEILKTIKRKNIILDDYKYNSNIIERICQNIKINTNEQSTILNYYFSLSNTEYKKYIKLKESMSEIAEYCVIDSQRCHELMKIRSVLMDKREISKLSYTSIFDAFYRANGMKVRNLVIARGQKFGIRFSNISNNNEIEEGKYPGAYVYPPKKGLITSKLNIDERIENSHLEKYREWSEVDETEKQNYYRLIYDYGCCYNEYYDNIIKKYKDGSQKLRKCFIEFLNEPMGRPITGLDFSSLYPSLIMTYNLSPEYIIVNKTDAKQAHNDGHDLHKIKFIYNGKIIRGWSIKHENKIDPLEDGFKFGVYPMILKELFDSRKEMKKSLHRWESEKEKLEALTKEEFNNIDTKTLYDNVCFNFNYINSKQKALKVFMNTFYGESGNKRSSFFVLQLAGAITSAGQENIKMVQRYVEEQKCKVYYGDSVSPDTPLILRNKNTKQVIIKTIDNLSNDWEPYEQFKLGEHDRIHKQQANCDLEIWTEGAWHNIRRVIRHKTNKKMYRINTHTGVVDVTEDHSLMTPNRTKIKPSDLTTGSELMHSFPTEFPEITIYPNETNINCSHCSGLYEIYNEHINNQCICNINRANISGYKNLTNHYIPAYYKYMNNIHVTKEEAYIWGLFMSSGSCYHYRDNGIMYSSWFIDNQNIKCLNQILKYLEICEPTVKFKVLDTMNTLGEYRLIAKSNIKYIYNKYKKLFYNKRNKIIPEQILNGVKDIRQSFYDGYCINYGNIKYITRKQVFYCKSKITSQCMYYLIKSLGYDYISVSTHSYKSDIYWFYIGVDGFDKNPIAIEKIIELPDATHDTFVYDIETSVGSFAGGVGSINVFNTDSLYLSMPDRCFELVDKQYYSNKITKLNYWNEMINITFRDIKTLNNNVNKLLKDDNGTDFLKMAFEESLFPVAFLAKKKYYGIPHISIPNFNPKELFIRGLEVKKRGVSGLLKKVCMDIMWNSVNISNIYTLIDLVLNMINHIYNNKWNFNDFIMTDIFKPTKQNIKIQTFAKRMSDAGIEVKPYERFNYVIVKTNPYNYDNRGRKVPKLIGEKMEFAERASQLNMEIDLDYYMKGSVNGQLSRLITYHELFNVDPIDNTADALKTADDKIYNNACKYIENYCKKYYTIYESKGKIYQKIFRISNKLITDKMKEYYSDDIVNLLGSNIDLEEIEKHLNYKAEQIVIKELKGYGKKYIDGLIDNTVKYVLNKDKETDDIYKIDPNNIENMIKKKINHIKSKKMIELQNIYFARKNNNLYQIREKTFIERKNILNRNIRDNINIITDVLIKHNDIVYNLSNDIKKILDIDNQFNNANDKVPDFEEFSMNKINYEHFTNEAESNLLKYLNDENVMNSLNKIRYIYINMKSNYSFIHRTYSIIDYLKLCRNKKNNITFHQKFLNDDLNLDINEKTNNDIDDIIHEIKNDKNGKRIF